MCNCEHIIHFKLNLIGSNHFGNRWKYFLPIYPMMMYAIGTSMQFILMENDFSGSFGCYAFHPNKTIFNVFRTFSYGVLN